MRVPLQLARDGGLNAIKPWSIQDERAVTCGILYRVAQNLRPFERRRNTAVMTNIFSILLGLIALIIAIPALIPFLGWVNWFVLIIAGMGLLLGLISSSNSGRNFNIFVIAICSLRLFVGGGLL